MDQRGEKEHSFQQSSDQRRKHKDDAAAAVPEGVHGESSTDQSDDGGPEAETAGVIVKEQVEVVEGEASAAPLLLAHACSLLQLLLLLRACDGCLVGLLHDYCSYDDPKPATNDDLAAAAPGYGVADAGRRGRRRRRQGGRQLYLYVQEVATPVLAARRPPPPPGPPEEGSRGHGGNHN